MKTKKRLAALDPNYHTGHPVPNSELNQNRLRAIEKACILALPQTILKLEKRIAMLQKQLEKAEIKLQSDKEELAARNGVS
ncbi:MAG: hypothetical protein KBF73_00120 [Flavobacteriales bacterium]|nr:hypothetical protein [Flavobacteriales bacterium]